MHNKLYFLILTGIIGCNAMDLSMEQATTNKVLAKYSGCFVAVKDTWLKGYSLTSDKSLAFVYLHPQDATDKNFIGYCVSVLEKGAAQGAVAYGMPQGLCAKPELRIRMASSKEFARAEEKIKNNQLHLSNIPDSKQALEFLKMAAAKMNLVCQSSKRKEEDPQPVRTSKRIKRPIKR